MSPPVFLLPPGSLGDAVTGTHVEVAGDEGKHGIRSLRLRVHESVELVDGEGRRVRGTVHEIEPAAFSVSIETVVDEDPLLPSLTVVQALAKGDRGESAVEMLTECGVDRIVPWSAERSISVWKADRRERGLRRWRSVAKAASKQARLARLPQVTELHSTSEVINLFGGDTQVLVLHEEAHDRLAATAIIEAKTLVLIVGPEGGLSGEEVSRFVEAGAHAVRLGDSVLRTSTAGVVAAAIVATRSGRWS